MMKDGAVLRCSCSVEVLLAQYAVDSLLIAGLDVFICWWQAKLL